MTRAPLVASDLGDELLDDPGADPAVVARVVREIARANRWFGGSAALRFGLDHALAGLPPGTTITLLDLGTGDAALPLEAAAYAAKQGVALQPLGVERSPVAARLARANGVPVLLADAGQLPIADASVDLVLINLVAHHFTPESIVRLFREADRVARRAVIVSDLQRSTAARWAFAVGARLLGFHRVTREDGYTSIQRGFLPHELAARCREADVAATVHARPFWRLVAWWRPVRAARAPVPRAA